MNLREIKELVKLLDKSTLNEIEIENDEYSIRLAKSNGVQVVNQALPLSIETPSPVNMPVAENTETSSTKNTNYAEIKSPMVGTFYAAANSESDAFVKVGDTISEGDTLCIIEAMKLMNELKAESSGKIVEILVQNAEPVEYNQVIFHIE